MDALLFIAKKVIAAFLFPVGLLVVLLAAGLVCWRRRPNGRWGPGLTAAALALLLFFSLPVTSNLLTGPLEDAAGPYADPAQLKARGVRAVVVLSGSHRRGDLTPADTLGGSSLLRLMEGVRLWKALGPEARLVLSGGGFGREQSAAAVMAQVAAELGVPKEAMRLEEGSWDTRDQAAALAGVLGREPFALVTSATHMPRAMLVFRNAGLNPLPAPADFRSRGDELIFAHFLPQAGALRASQIAVYEYIGRIWTWLTGPSSPPAAPASPLPSAPDKGK